MTNSTPLGDRACRAPTAFALHDTYGFPLELTQEIAGERSIDVDLAGFESEMAAQRERAKAARKGNAADDGRLEGYREVLDQFGQTDFVGYVSDESQSRVLAVIRSEATDGDDGGTVEIFLDRTPFYAESGGQVGDTGTIVTDTGRAEVLDTTFALPGLRRHTARIVEGDVIGRPGGDGRRSTSSAAARSAATTPARTCCTGRCAGCSASTSSRPGSYVGPDRLRFDFSHYESVTAEQIAEIERLVNAETLRNERARIFETTKAEAEALGAIAFFGDKYGDFVRVLEAGPSVELCGGTHVSATGDIGLLKVVSESSIGSNLRRIEAITGAASVELLQHDEAALAQIGSLVGTAGGDVVTGVQRKLDEIKSLQAELKQLRGQLASGRATEIAAAAADGVVVQRDRRRRPGRSARPRDRRPSAAGHPPRGADGRHVHGRRVARRRRAGGRRASRPPISSRPRPGPSAAVAAARATSPRPAARIRPGSTRRCASRWRPPPRER